MKLLRSDSRLIWYLKSMYFQLYVLVIVNTVLRTKMLKIEYTIILRVCM